MSNYNTIIAEFPIQHERCGCACNIVTAAEILRYCASTFGIDTKRYVQVFGAEITLANTPERPLTVDEVEDLLDAADYAERHMSDACWVDEEDDFFALAYCEQVAGASSWDISVELLEKARLPIIQCWDGQPEKVFVEVVDTESGVGLKVYNPEEEEAEMEEYKFHYEVKCKAGSNDTFAGLGFVPHDFEPVGIFEEYEVYELHTTTDVQAILDQLDGVIEYTELN